MGTGGALQHVRACLGAYCVTKGEATAPFCKRIATLKKQDKLSLALALKRKPSNQKVIHFQGRSQRGAKGAIAPPFSRTYTLNSR